MLQVMHPTEAELDALAGTLRRGQQRAVGGGVYVRVDAQGRLRYQFRLREGGARSCNSARTFDSWVEADAERRRRLELKQPRSGGRSYRPHDRMSVEDYAHDVWWPFLSDYAEPITRRDYARVLARDILPYWHGWRLGDIGINEVEAFARHLRQTKQITVGSRRGEVPEAACRRAVDILGHVLGDALDRGILQHNPVAAYRRMEKRRSRGRPQSYRQVRRRFVQQPRTVELIRLAIRGRGPWQQHGRAIVSLAAWEGLRPNEIIALTHGNWRDRSGPRSHLHISRGAKEIGGRMIERGTKTHRDREVELWPVVAEELGDLYQNQDCPPLSALVFPNGRGGYANWNNWRDRTWYPALYRAGISGAPSASADGAFDPYSLRHTYATLLFQAVKPSGRRYSPPEIARQLGCTIETLFRVYVDIIDDTELVGGTVDDIVRAARRSAAGGERVSANGPFQLSLFGPAEVRELADCVRIGGSSDGSGDSVS